MWRGLYSAVHYSNLNFYKQNTNCFQNGLVRYLIARTMYSTYIKHLY
jgi:hypothetical protein